MPIAKAFKSLGRRLAKSGIGVRVVITMDGVPVPTHGLWTRRAVGDDTGNQVYLRAAPTMAFQPSTLPRKPRAGDVFMDDEGLSWRIGDAPPEDYGIGMLEYPLKRA